MAHSTPRVLGIGGVFFKARDPAALGEWYRTHLGFDVGEWGGARFEWKKHASVAAAYTVWSPFKESTEYLRPSDKPYMLNLLVDDLEGLLAKLRAGGVKVEDRREDGDYGKFAYVLDPEGTLLELWQPSDPHPDD